MGAAAQKLRIVADLGRDDHERTLRYSDGVLLSGDGDRVLRVVGPGAAHPAAVCAQRGCFRRREPVGQQWLAVACLAADRSWRGLCVSYGPCRLRTKGRAATKFMLPALPLRCFPPDATPWTLSGKRFRA